MKRVTSKDIAREAGVSQAAVSYVLTGCWRERGISQKTQERILGVSRRLGYRENRLARGLKLGRTRLLGILAPCVTFSYFSEIVRGAEDVADEHGYALILMHTDEDSVTEARKIDILRDHCVEGMLIIPAILRPRGAIFRELQEGGVPFVLVDKRLPNAHCHFVGTQDREGARQAVDYLVSLGHRRIAHLRGPAGVSTSDDRLQGYLDALGANGITPDDRLMTGDDWNEEANCEATRRLLRMSPRPTAIFACADMAAWGACVAIREAGLRIPEDVSVVGFADLDPSARLAVPLTSVRQPAREVGRQAMEKLIRLIDKGEDEPREVRLPTQLTVRASCARINGTAGDCAPGTLSRRAMP